MIVYQLFHVFDYCINLTSFHVLLLLFSCQGLRLFFCTYKLFSLKNCDHKPVFFSGKWFDCVKIAVFFMIRSSVYAGICRLQTYHIVPGRQGFPFHKIRKIFSVKIQTDSKYISALKPVVPVTKCQEKSDGCKSRHSHWNYDPEKQLPFRGSVNLGRFHYRIGNTGLKECS